MQRICRTFDHYTKGRTIPQAIGSTHDILVVWKERKPRKQSRKKKGGVIKKTKFRTRNIPFLEE